MTFLLFVSAILAGLLFRKSKLCTIYIFAIMYVFSAYRTFDADYNAYLIGYNNLSRGTAYRYVGYSSFLKIFSNMGLSFDAYNRIFFLIVFILLLVSVRLLTRNINAVLALYLIYPYSLDVVQMKSCIADILALISIVLVINLKTHYLDEERKRKIASVVAIMSLFLAACMHFSAAYYSLTLALYLVVRNRENLGIKMLVLSCSMIALLYSGFLVIIIRFANKLGILGELDYIFQWTTKSTRYGYLLYFAIIGLMVLSTTYNHVEMIKNKRQQELRYFLMSSLLILPFVFLNAHYLRLLRIYIILTYSIFADQDRSSVITGKRILNNIMCFVTISVLFYFEIANNYSNVLGALLNYNSLFGVLHY
uniref:EpsG family protein n=1 Tax=Eubacterium cellulosolvens TaxID=29322 RepID=UPI000489299D|nr:EpsG family protein [[Eubacterium] cellulosolvens]